MQGKGNIKDFKMLYPYTFVCSDETLKKLQLYKQDLIENKACAGKYLLDSLDSKNLSTLTDEQFVDCLVQTKLDNFNAISAYFNEELNWNARELSLLGDLSCVIPTRAHDNGAWHNPSRPNPPIDVTLIYVPAPLLRNSHNDIKHLTDRENITPDLDEVKIKGQFDFDAYYRMLERRILPGLLHVNNVAAFQGKTLFVTVPGIGFKRYAGEFEESIPNYFKLALRDLLINHGQQLTQIKAIWYDGYDKAPDTQTVGGIDFLIRPLMKGGLPQLCAPKDYGKKYSQCDLVSLVDSDHVTKPGNSYWLKGSRENDNAAKTAATEVIPAITGQKGIYHVDTKKMVPQDPPNQTWARYMKEDGLLRVDGNFNHYPITVPFKNNENHPQAKSDSFFNNSSVISLLMGLSLGLLVAAPLLAMALSPPVLAAIGGAAAVYGIATGVFVLVSALAGVGTKVVLASFEKQVDEKPERSVPKDIGHSANKILDELEVKTQPTKKESENQDVSFNLFKPQEKITKEEVAQQVKESIQSLNVVYKIDMEQQYREKKPVLLNHILGKFELIASSDDVKQIDEELAKLEQLAKPYNSRDNFWNDIERYVGDVRQAMKPLEDSLSGEQDNNVRLSLR